jgi:hypothetical protein
MPRLMRAPRLLTGSLALMLVVSCENPVCGCITPSRAVVYGRVANPAGAGVPGAAVHTGLGFPRCEPGMIREIGSTRTEADGRYRLELRTLEPLRPEGCLRAYANPPGQGTLLPSDTVPLSVELRYEGRMDSVRVDLVLRAP